MSEAPLELEPPKTQKTEVGSVFVSNYPPFSVWTTDHVEHLRQALESPPRPGTDLGLYMHIPFCRKRCKFCYFRVYTDRNAEQIQVYLDALSKEIEMYARKPAIDGRPLRFVYFGGGTPSYIAVKHLKVLVERARAALPWDDVEEVTFECEPGTLTETKVHAYRDIGVTRLSLGVENWDDAILEENGRAHLTGEIHRCLPWIRQADFPQLNVDLIAGMVGETWDTWKRTVQKTIDIDPDSVTVYQMELPFNTVYSKGILHEGQPIPVADWPLKREWNDYAIEEMCRAGYEISSAYTLVKRRDPDAPLPPFVYRDALWQGADMIGSGVASFGHLSGIHVQNDASWKGYLDPLSEGRLPHFRAWETRPEEAVTREMLLQMKLGRVDLRHLAEKFDIDPRARFGEALDALVADGLAELSDEGSEVHLTRTGLLRVDSLLPAFYDERYRGVRYT